MVEPEKEEVSFSVYYLDENGANLTDPQIYTGLEGEEYSLSALSFEGYTLKQDSQEIYQGSYQKEMSDITFHYSKDTPTPVEQGTIIVKYVAVETNEVIKESTTLTGDVNTNFTVATPTIEGYTFNKTASSKLTGTYTKATQTLTLRYDKEPATESKTATITIRWVDQSGKSIKQSRQLKGKVGDEYDLNKYKLEIDGYKLDSTKLPKLTGVLKDNMDITFYYNADADSNNSNNEDVNNDNSKPNNDNKQSDVAGNSNNSTTANKDNFVVRDKTDPKGNIAYKASYVDNLPKAGNSNNPWLTLAGVGTLSALTFAWFFRRKRD